MNFSVVHTNMRFLFYGKHCRTNKEEFVAIMMFLQMDHHHVSQPKPWAHDHGKGLQICRPKVSSGITFHASRSVRKCEGMNPHTTK